MMIEHKLEKARADYQLKLLDRLESLGRLIGRLRSEHELRSVPERRRREEPQFDLETVSEAQQLAHRIYGSAGTFGFATTGEAVKIIDQALLSVLEEKVSANRALWDRLEQALRQAQEASQ